MTPEQWLACAKVLETFYPHNFKMTDEVKMDLWYQMLADLPGENVLAAIKHMVQTQPAFPSVADVRKHADPNACAPTEAWRKACDWVCRASQGNIYAGGKVYPPPEMDDPAIMGAIEAIGFQAIRMRTYDDEPAMRAHFFRAYEEALNSGRRWQTFTELGIGNERVAALAAGIGRQVPGDDDEPDHSWLEG